MALVKHPLQCQNVADRRLDHLSLKWRGREMEIYYSIRIFEIPIFACLENVLRFAAVQMMLARTHSGGGKEEATYGTEAEPPPDNLSEAVRVRRFCSPVPPSVRPRLMVLARPFRAANFVRGGNTSPLRCSLLLSSRCCAVIGYPLRLASKSANPSVGNRCWVMSLLTFLPFYLIPRTPMNSLPK